MLIDLKKPASGFSPNASPYVQLSRGTSLDRLSIMRPFDIDELRTPLPVELLKELEWEKEMADQTARLYGITR